MENKEYENIVKVPLSPIGQDELDANSVGEVQIQNGAITAKKIRAGQILTDHLAAGAVTADKIFGNAISTYSLTVASRVKGSTVVFNVVSDGTYLRKLTWTSGALRLSKVVFGEGENLGDITETTISQSISSGYYTFTDSDTEYYFYVVWEADDNGEPKDSATLTVQKSQEYPMTQNAVPLIYAWYDSTLKMVQFRAVNSINGVLISGNSIIAGSIQADNIKAGTITVDKIKAGTITTDRLNFAPYVIGTNTLDDVVNGTTYKRVKSAAIDANGMILLDQTTDGTYSKVLSTDIQAGHIKLDSVIDGTYGKVLSTDIQAGHIKLDSVIDGTYGRVKYTDISDGHLVIGQYTVYEPGYTPNVTIRSPSQPSTRPNGKPLVAGDVWIDTDYGDLPYTYDITYGWTRSYTKIDGGYIETGTISADKISVSNLSAISANIGTITAGSITGVTITGSHIKTNTYADSYIDITDGTSVLPSILFYYQKYVQFQIQEGAADLKIMAVNGNELYLLPNTNHSVYVGDSAHLASLVVSRDLLAGFYAYGHHILNGTVGITGDLSLNSGIYFCDSYGNQKVKLNFGPDGGLNIYDVSSGRTLELYTDGTHIYGKIGAGTAKQLD